MNSILKLIQSKKYLKTYNVGLLQTKAYRTLKQKTNKALKQFGIGGVEWAFLGVLSEQKKGMRLIALAEELDVDAPFVTALGSKLQKMDLVIYEKDHSDARAKTIALSKEGKRFVEKVEKIMRKEAKSWMSGVTLSDAVAYVKVLEKIVGNQE